MFGGNGYPSVADIAAAFPDRGRSNDGWGNDGGGWWILIILLALFGGFGNGGWGGFGGNSGAGYTDAALQRGFDTQTLINKLDGINSGLCSLGYDQLAQMNGINTNILQTGFGIQQAINADTVANMQNTNGLSRQIGDCCCEQRAAIKDVQYAIAQNGCDTRQAIHQVGDTVNNNMNWNFRDMQDTIRDGFAAAEARENARYIRELEARVNTAERKSELGELYNNLIAYLAPQPRPAYLSCNPSTGMVVPNSLFAQMAWAQNGFGYNGWGNGCSSGCGGCCG